MNRLLRSAVIFCLAVGVFAAEQDPLPSWREGPAKQRTIAFIAEVTTPGSSRFVPPDERTAVFDNDGTLWPEKPLVEGLFMLSRLPVAVQRDPTLAERPAIKAALAGDRAYFHDHGYAALLEVVAATHGNLTEEQFATAVHEWLATARYPKPDRPVVELAYQPMLELLACLRANGFQTWICSGGTAGFIRQLSQRMYGIPPQQVIGSTLKSESRTHDGLLSVFRLPQLELFNDQEAKPVALARQLGQRPLFACGNIGAAGDLAMLGYGKGRQGPSFQLLVEHDDADRESAYAERDGASLAAAAAQGYVVVRMASDWATVFAPPRTSLLRSATPTCCEGGGRAALLSRVTAVNPPTPTPTP